MGAGGTSVPTAAASVRRCHPDPWSKPQAPVPFVFGAEPLWRLFGLCTECQIKSDYSIMAVVIN